MPQDLTEEEKAVRAAQHVATINRNFGPAFSRHGFALTNEHAATVGFANDGGVTVKFFYETRFNTYAFDGLALLTFPDDPDHRIPLPTVFDFFRDNRGLDVAQFDGVRNDRIQTEVDRYGALFDLCVDELLATPDMHQQLRDYQSSTGVHDPKFRPGPTPRVDIVWEPYNLVGESLHVESVQRFQSDNGIVFPEEYLTLLGQHMGQSPETANVEVGGFTISPGYLLGFVDGCIDNPRDFADTVPYSYFTSVHFHGFPERIVPFMSGGGGDLAFDYRRTDSAPPVIFLDGESEVEDAVFNVANNFVEFINKKFVSPSG